MDLNNLRLRKYQHLQAQLQKKLSSEISKVTRLLQDSLQDLTQQMEPGGTKQVLNLALDVIRPYVQSLGLRVSRLSFRDIEVVLPGNLLSQDSHQQIDEGAVISAALFSYKKLWKKNSPRGGVNIEIKSFEFEKIRALRSTLYLRCRLPDQLREAIYVELSGQKTAAHESIVQIFDAEDQLMAKVAVKAELKMEKGLPWGSQKKFGPAENEWS